MSGEGVPLLFTNKEKCNVLNYKTAKTSTFIITSVGNAKVIKISQKKPYKRQEH